MDIGSSDRYLAPIVSRPRRSLLAVAALCAIATAALLAGPVAGASAKDELTAVVAEVIATPEVVLGDDNRRHFAYELDLQNRSSSAVTIKSIKTVAGGKVVNSLVGKAVTARMNPFGGKGLSNELQGGQGGYVLMDVSFPRKAKLPSGLVHRITISEKDPSPANATTYLTAPTPVIRTPAVVLAPPLRGSDWVVGNGCCDEFDAHRGTVLPVNGTNWVAERFAIDFVQVDPMGRLFEGSANALSLNSYPYFGDQIHAAAPGRVVAVLDGIPETPAGGFPPNPTAQTAGGNHVVVDIGHGRFAFYAHMQPGSITVKKGARVKTGQVLGLLGNSGNSDGPHLHFHVMDGPSPLASNGMPYRFTNFSVSGTLTNLPAFEKGAVATIAPKPQGARAKMLPLNLQVIDFGG